MSAFARTLRLKLTASAHWAQAVRFAAVGASGYGVNLLVYSAALQAGLDFRLAATFSFIVAAASNYTWNRIWTFRATGKVSVEAPRFLAVSVLALAANVSVLGTLVALGATHLQAQAAAILLVAPLSFLANKHWSFSA
jgi:putative flippase GtrA